MVYGEKTTKDATTACGGKRGSEIHEGGGGGYRGIRVCRTVWSECGESARTRYPVRRWRACGGIEGGEAAQARRDERYERLRSPSGAAHLEGLVCVRRGICGKWRERCVTVEVARKTLCEAKTRSLSLARACVSLPQRKVPCKNSLSLSGCGFHPHHNPPTSPNLSASSKPLYLVQAFFRFSPQ